MDEDERQLSYDTVASLSSTSLSVIELVVSLQIHNFEIAFLHKNYDNENNGESKSGT